MGYASDLRDQEWQPLLEPRQKGRPRKHGLREICNADPLCAENGMPVADAAAGFSAVACGIYDILALAEQRPVGTDHA